MKSRRIFDGTVQSILAYIDALPVEPDGCILWDRSSPNGRYGQAYIKQHRVLVHRLMLERRIGRPLGRTEQALHKCDVPRCCNPDHLFVGTHADNMADMAAKGRGTSGNKGRHRFDATDASVMRQLFDRGYTFTEIGPAFGTSRQQVRTTLLRHQLYPAPELHRGGPLRRRPA